MLIISYCYVTELTVTEAMTFVHSSEMFFPFFQVRIHPKFDLYMKYFVLTFCKIILSNLISYMGPQMLQNILVKVYFVALIRFAILIIFLLYMHRFNLTNFNPTVAYDLSVLASIESCFAKFGLS